MMQFFLTLFAITFLTSCDCNQIVNGTILDNKTGKPLSNITVYNKNKNWSKTKTDSAGHFQLSSISGGFGCPPMTIIVEDNNYGKIETSIDAGGQKEIRLKQLIKIDTLNQTKAIKILRGIFEEYVQEEEGIDSEENKITMTKTLSGLRNVTNPKDLRLLIDIWNYYDPTDYSCRKEVYSVLQQNKQISIQAVRERMTNRMKWESEDLDGTEFNQLLKQLENE